MENLSKEEFLKVFSSSFYKKVLNESLLSFKRAITKSEAKDLMYNAYKKLIRFDYYVSNPVEYIFLLKNEFVARIIPVFSLEDEAIYFYLCKRIEEDIANNRIPGTFGGWMLGNAIKTQEEDEIQYVFNSYNPWLWTKYWKEFQHYVYSNIDRYDYKYALKLDIANFYDSINIDILSKKLYRICSKDKYEFIELIVYILKYWNRRFSSYSENNVGIPQNEFGDQSRLLANVYLNEYDEKMYNICNKYNAMYSRYADDQIILFDNEEDINNIMLFANEELRKLGLNINAGKTKKFTKEQLIDYFAFIPLEHLEKKEFDIAANMFFDMVEKYGDISDVRSDTFFRRCLSSGLDKFNNTNRNKILSYVLTKDFIINSNVDYLCKIFKNLNEEEKRVFIMNLEKYYRIVKFNGFHYIIINFFKKAKLKDYYKKYSEEVSKNYVSL